jgi:2-polyprenyl-3-methyl-5-hydroxy-6-metoxy-1,4-benzoquinol methylase
MDIEEQFDVKKAEGYEFFQLDPVPDSELLSEFYESKYYDLIKEGDRAYEIRRLMEPGEERDKELAWLQATFFGDICHLIKARAPGKKLLEVGSGTGDFLEFAMSKGIDVFGIEPSEDAVDIAGERGIETFKGTLEAYVAKGGKTFDAVVMVNVLEHVPDPAAFVSHVHSLLNPGGLIIIRVPNDFSEIQLAAHAKLGADPWWISTPDHINYFNFDSLDDLLGKLGFDVIHAQGDFPMELFLLMGDNYVGNQEIGSQSHSRRQSFEMAIPAELRRAMYQKLAQTGVGRDCLVFGKKA